MFFSKLFLRGFGKFNNTGLALKKGINVVTSEEEGKSDSVRAFLLGMLFGIPQRSGITKVRSGYQSYKPVKGSDYSGTAYLNDEDKSYLIERDFLGTGKTSVLDVQSGREIRLSQTNSLTGAVLNADRNTYIDEKVITELEADSSDEASRKFEKYLQNMMVTGTSSIDYETSKRYLMAEKKKNASKPLVRRLNQLDRAMSKYDGVDEKIDQIEAELKKLNEDFIIEAEKRKRVARRLVENEDGSVTYQQDEEVDEKMDRLTASEKTYGAQLNKEDEDEAGKKKFTDRIPVIIGTGVLVVLIISFIVYLLPFDNLIREMFVIITALAVIVTMLDGFRVKGFFDVEDEIDTPDEDDFKKVLKELEDEGEERAEIEFDMTFAKEYAEKKEELKAREDVLLDKRREKNKLKREFDLVFKKKSELEDEEKAIDYALARLAAISQKFMKDAVEKLLPHMNDFVPLFTNGKVEGLLYEGNNLQVKTEDGIQNLNELPLEDIQKIYLAVRLSIARALGSQELPLIISGTDMLDDDALISLVELLELFEDEQILILSDNTNLKEVFPVEANFVEA